MKHRFLMIGLGLFVVSQSPHNQPITSMIQPAQGLPQVNRLSLTNDQTQHVLTRLDARIEKYRDDYEARLLKGLLLFHTGDNPHALDELTELTRLVPDFHLAHLVRGDIMAARSNTVAFIGKGPLFANTNRATQDQLSALQQEAWARLHAHLQAVDPQKLPLSLLQMATNVKRVLLVDKTAHRLYVFERQDQDAAPQLVRDFYVSTGKLVGNKQKQGDLRTPEGVYFVTSYIPDDKLPDKYGSGAYPVDYPNALDRRMGKTGDGIWLHGTEHIYYSRPPLDSEGCVVLTNLDLKSVAPFITIGATPIVIADKVSWVDKDQWLAQRQGVLQAIEDWRRDWESLNVDRYLGHYGQQFWNEQFSLASWKAHKARVNQSKTYQKVSLSDISLFTYPVTSQNGENLVLASFRQGYQSNNFNSETSKHMYLSQQGGRWQIVYEGR